MTKQSCRFVHRRWVTRTITAVISASALAVAFVPGATAATAATHTPASHIVKAGGGKITLHRIGTVNLRALARADARRMKSASPAKTPAHGKMTPLRLPPAAASAGSKASSRAVPAGRASTKFAGNVKGAHGFDGITAAINGAANSPITGGVGDVSPPDQGMAVGPSTAGTAIVEYVNDSLVIYSPSGRTLLGAIPGQQIFGLPAKRFLPTRAHTGIRRAATGS